MLIYRTFTLAEKDGSVKSAFVSNSIETTYFLGPLGLGRVFSGYTTGWPSSFFIEIRSSMLETIDNSNELLCESDVDSSELSHILSGRSVLSMFRASESMIVSFSYLDTSIWSENALSAQVFLNTRVFR